MRSIKSIALAVEKGDDNGQLVSARDLKRLARAYLDIEPLFQDGQIATKQAAWEMAAELADILASKTFSGGSELYRPEWYRKPGAKYLTLGDGGAVEAIKSGNPDKMRAAIEALKAYA